MALERRRWMSACAIVSLVFVSIELVVAAQDFACASCDTLTVSGAGNASINGAYTFDGIMSEPEYFAGSLVWLGPAWNQLTERDPHWALVRLPGSTWIGGVVVIVDNGEYGIYVVEGYYTNQSPSRCPPETGWKSASTSISPAPTLSRAGCLCAGIGDLNDDGSISVIDARLLFAHASGCSMLTAEWLERADIDDDGDVDEDDARFLAQLLIGLCP